MTWPSLSQWLDPGNTGAVTLDTLDPNASGMSVSSGNLVAQGDSGGPFTPASIVYTVANRRRLAPDFSVTTDVNWVDITGGSGTL